MTTFTRLTVVGTAREAELVVPDDEAIGGLIPRLMALLEEPTGPVARPLALVRSTGEQLDDARSAAEQDLADGEQLRLVRADDAPPPPEVADVTDVVGDTYAERGGRWSSAARQTTGAIALGATTCVASVSLAMSTSTVWALVLIATAVAILLGRLGHRWPAIALVAVAAGAAPAATAAIVAQAGLDRSARVDVGVRRSRLGRPGGRRRSRPAPTGGRARRGWSASGSGRCRSRSAR